MTENTTEMPMYLVPGKVAPEMEHRAQTIVFDRYGRELLWPEFHAYMTAIGTPIQPCADVETAAVIRAPSPVTPTVTKAVKRDLFPVGVDMELVRRTDMEMKLSLRDRLVKATMRALDAKTDHYLTARNERDVLKEQIAEKDAEIARLKENALPDEMTPEIEAALGIICFQAAPFAHAFRAAGANIPRKAEAEQAYVIFRLLKDVLRLGDFGKAWSAILEEARAAQKAGGEA